MIISKQISIILSLALATSGCSSRPRYFVPTLNPPAADAATFESNMATCRGLVGQGYKTGFKDAAARVGGGTAIGLGAGAAIGAAGPATFGTLAAASYAFPIVGFVAGFGISRVIRTGREKKLKSALTDCMSEYGYTVEAWVPTKRPKPAAKSAISEADKPPSPSPTPTVQ
jgi:hypothetical protein